jgi:hypothetical protein
MSADNAVFAVRKVGNSSLVKAEQAAVRPIVDYSSIRGLETESPFLPAPQQLSASKKTKKVHFSIDTKRGKLSWRLLTAPTWRTASPACIV